MTISNAQLTLISNTFMHLKSLSLVRVSLVIDEDPPHANTLRRSLQHLHLEDVTNFSASWHPILDIVAFTSLFDNTDDLRVTVDFFHVNQRPLRRAVEDIRADTSWTANVSHTPLVSRLRIEGLPTTAFHILRFLRTLHAGHTLSTIRISVLDPDIITEIEGILYQNPSVIQKLDLVFSPDMESLLRGEFIERNWSFALLTCNSAEERHIGFLLETMHHRPLTWTIDTSLLTNAELDLLHANGGRTQAL